MYSLALMDGYIGIADGTVMRVGEKAILTQFIEAPALLVAWFVDIDVHVAFIEPIGAEPLVACFSSCNVVNVFCDGSTLTPLVDA